MKRAFTLIELLVVIAIIAILALIAIPNFLEAQVRSKVARVQADLRSITTAIELYTVDYNRAPIGIKEAARGIEPANWGVTGGFIEKRLWTQLTTPVAYLTSFLADPFVLGNKTNMQSGALSPTTLYEYQTYLWSNPNLPSPGPQPNSNSRVYLRRSVTWSLMSVGPSRMDASAENALSAQTDVGINLMYDPTNGTMSQGLIIRTNKGDFASSQK